MTTQPTNITNPYVGPRTFERAQHHLFFGREREARDLLARVISQRLTLFYAQSGVGKSSLVNTRLIPQLEQDAGFAVLPVGRISGALPASVQTVDNIFLFNLMLRLVQDGGDPQRFAHLSLSDFLAHLISNDGQTFHYVEQMSVPSPPTNQGAGVAPYVLIIDQFEEIITTHLDRWHERAAFFQQLNQAMLADPNLWVVLVLREDYVASLDPFAGLMAERMRARFYMQRMEREAALEAIQKPATLGGRPFAPGVAETLADNLRLIRVLGVGQAASVQLAERSAAVLGQYIEPVQLQVVCYQLWENLKDHPPSPITAIDLPLDYIDQALSQFYTGALDKTLHDPAVQAAGVSERFLRNWFSNVLITEARTRSIIYRDETTGRTASLPNAAVDLLTQQFLLHTEVRSGGIWVELIHDRFIEPIVKANLAWQASYHNPLATAYQAWQAAGGSGEKLLRGPQLADAIAYTESHPNDVTPEEWQFLAQSQRQDALEQEQARQTVRRWWIVTMTAIAVIITLSALTIWALRNAARADENALSADKNAQAARAQKIVAQAQAAQQHGNLLVRSALLATESLQAKYSPETEDILRESLTLLPVPLAHVNHSQIVGQVAFSPDGRWIASASEDNTATVNDAVTGKLIVLLTATSPVHAVAFSPDGQRLATGGGDGTVQVWQIKTGQEIAHLTHDDVVVQLVFNADGKWLATASADGTARVWEVDTQRELLRVTHDAKVNSVAFSPNGQWIATASDDGTAQVWDVTQNKEVVRLPHDGQVFQASFSPDGKQLATASSDFSAHLWDIATGRALARFRHNNWVEALAYSPDGKQLATASDDKTVRVWDVATGQERLRQQHEDGVNVVKFSPNGQWLASASNDHTARVWTVTNGQEIARVVHENSVMDVVFSPDGQRLVTASLDKTARVWEIAAAPALHTIQQNTFIWNVAFSPDGRRLAIASDDDFTTSLWDVASGAKIIQLPTSQKTVYAVTFSPDGKWLATGGADASAHLWNLAAPTEVVNLSHDDAVSSVAFSLDGKWLATGSVDHTVRIWEIATRNEMTRFPHDHPVMAVAFAAHGQQLVTADYGGIVRVWDVARGKMIRELTHADLPVLAIALNRDETRLATASTDGAVRLWDVGAGQEILPRLVHGGEVSAVTFSPDGQWLATGSADGTARIWEVATGQEVARVQQPDPINVVAFSSDGQRFVTNSTNVTQLWDFRQFRLVHTPDLIPAVCARLTRNLTLAEWKQYFGEEPYRRTCPNLPAGAGVTGVTG